MEATGIRSREAVRWLSPWTLLSMLFAVLSKRLPARRPTGPEIAASPLDLLVANENGDRWIDFIADTGDGFDASVTIASLLAEDDLLLDEYRLPRASLLVHGGDMVYPAGSDVGYRERFVGPMEAMFPIADPSPMMAGIPGNHDYYDGLKAWRRLMNTSGRIGGWTTAQTQPWFGVQLSERWWLWGVDVQEAGFDGAQLTFFSELANALEPGSQVAVVAAQPVWELDDPANEDHAMVASLIEAQGAELRVILTGDVHNYHRYTSTEEPVLHAITCGGGGAFLSPSHTLIESTQINGEPLKLVSESVYPTPAVSRSLIRRAPSLLWRNGNLPLMLASVYALVGAILGDGSIIAGRGLLALGAVLAATLAFTRQFTVTSVIAAIVHAALHLALILGVVAIQGPGLIGTVSLAVVGATLGSSAMGLAMVFAATRGINLNELFAAIRVDDYRCFLRLCVSADEVLTVFPIGVDKTQRRWHPCAPEKYCPSRLEPEQAVVAKLIEPPIIVDPSMPRLVRDRQD